MKLICPHCKEVLTHLMSIERTVEVWEKELSYVSSLDPEKAELEFEYLNEESNETFEIEHTCPECNKILTNSQIK